MTEYDKTPAEKYIEERAERPWVSIPEIFEWCDHLDEISEAQRNLLEDILL
jgi:hypothetical protein